MGALFGIADHVRDGPDSSLLTDGCCSTHVLEPLLHTLCAAQMPRHLFAAAQYAWRLCQPLGVHG